MSFDDLALPNAVILKGEFFDQVVSSNLYIPIAVEDTDGSLFDWSTGYTATMTLNRADGTNVVTITNTLTNGRQIDLNPPEDATLVIRGTVAGIRTLLEPHVGRSLTFSLKVTRTADLFAVDVMRDCAIRPLSAND